MAKMFYAALVLASPMLAQITINPLPTREFGQPELAIPLLSAAPNLVEGRELLFPAAVAFDSSVNPPHVYVSDTGNNRVLGWSNANSNGTGAGQANQGNFADMVLGQPGTPPQSFYSTGRFGPGTTNSTGLNTPTGLAVDANGNIYVADSGNNRILRFKAPYKQPLGDLIVDLVIGQSGTNGTSSAPNNQPNQGLPNPSATSLYLSVGNSAGQPYTAALALDGSGNLWVADPGNNRVLRFPVSSLTAGTVLPVADTVLGQTSFTSNQLPQQNRTQTNLGFLNFPSSVAVDSQGNLYVSDQAGRVLVYQAPLSLGQSAAKVLGVPPALQAGQSPTPYPNSSTLGSVNTAGTTITGSPQGVFVLNGSQGASVFVADSPQSRVVRYDTFAGTWQVQAPANSPTQNGVVGQTDLVSGQANQGQTGPSNQTFNYPVAGAINPSNNEMWVVDQLNHRVVAFASQGGGSFSIASRVLGQNDFNHGTANLIEGREIWINGGGGIVVDSTSCSQGPPISCSGPPHLYLADTLNNRVLGFNDARNVGTDVNNLLTRKADLVIGQTDLLSALINSPGNKVGQPTATGLYQPVGLAVDANGNLWVADSGNGRVVRFPAPFAQPAGSVQTANLVLGEPDFVTFAGNVSQFSMVQPYGLALFANGSLAVSDELAHRILVFNRPAGADFTNGAGASLVVGQPSFIQAAAGSGNQQFNSPRHIAVDSSDRLYVCDYNNGRLMVFSKPTANNPTAVLEVPNLGQPDGVIVSFLTGLSWVASYSNNILYQLPEFQTLQNTLQPTQELSSYGPLAVALDPFDNVIVADSANRITFYFGELFYRNTANFSAGIGLTAGPTPTMLAALGRLGSPFGFTPTYSGVIQNLAPPWQTTVNNVQVTVAGLPAPIFRLDPTVAFIEIPNGAPTSGNADIVVSNPTTGQILAVATYAMQPASPGLYTTNTGGTGQVAAFVYDSKGNYVNGLTPNGPSNPVSAGGIIGLWLTGAGNVPGLPADGVPPGTVVYTPVSPLVYINGELATLIGSAMSPQFPGLWQINAVVPLDTPSSKIQPISIVVKMDGPASNIGGTINPVTGTPGPDQNLTGANGLITTIYVK